MNKVNLAKLTAEEETRLISLIQRCSWPLSPKVFDALLGLMPSDACELVTITEVNAGGRTEPRVLLFPRPDDDPFFKGLVHGAGTVKRGPDTEESALKRLLTKELGGPENVSTPRFVGVLHVPKGPLPDCCPRGAETGLVYYSRWNGGPLPKGVILGDPDDLPSNTIGFHRPMIAMAVERYKNDNAVAL